MTQPAQTPPGSDSGSSRFARWRVTIDSLDAALMAIGSGILLLLMLHALTNVALRNLFKAPIAWSYEVVSSHLMPGLFFLAV